MRRWQIKPRKFPLPSQGPVPFNPISFDPGRMVESTSYNLKRLGVNQTRYHGTDTNSACATTKPTIAWTAANATRPPSRCAKCKLSCGVTLDAASRPSRSRTARLSPRGWTGREPWPRVVVCARPKKDVRFRAVGPGSRAERHRLPARKCTYRRIYIYRMPRRFRLEVGPGSWGWRRDAWLPSAPHRHCCPACFAASFPRRKNGLFGPMRYTSCLPMPLDPFNTVRPILYYGLVRTS